MGKRGGDGGDAAGGGGGAQGKRKGSGNKLDAETRELQKKFKRGHEDMPLRGIKDRKTKGQMRMSEKLASDAALSAAQASKWLLPAEAGGLEAEGMERTYRFKQADIVQAVDVQTSRKAFDLKLEELGPYSIDFSNDGRHLLLGGRKGHLAVTDWSRARMVTELQVRETTRAVTFMHNHTFFAAAQKKYVYIYDKRGIEVHCLKEHTDVNRLSFLPHHFLLASVGEQGVLKYQDSSTGVFVAAHRTKLGPCRVMQQNPWNAVMCLGHAGGVVTMWTPNQSEACVKMLCHRGPLTSLAVDPTGRHMVTAGMDGQVKVWDVRTFQPIHSYFSHHPAECVDISQRGLLAVGARRKVSIWQGALTSKQKAPYMMHHLETGVCTNLQFCPYEDVLAVGHSGGVSTMIVPGAGEPNFDSFVANPYETLKQRREKEVHKLLDKLQPDMIVMDPTSIGQVRRLTQEEQKERAAVSKQANAEFLSKQRDKNTEKTKVKGKNRPTRRLRKKQDNVVDDRREEMAVKLREEGQKADAKERVAREAAKEALPTSLRRLAR